MGFYIRDSITIGPIRINISKSGLGLSFGVTGLRLGIGPAGPYFHAGRYGLYYKKSLKGLEENQEEILDENVNTDTEPQSIWKKIYIYFANFVVGFFIVSLLITIIGVYFFVNFLKFAGSQKRKPKINRKSKKRRY